MSKSVVVRIFQHGKNNRKALPLIPTLYLSHNIPFSFFVLDKM